MKKTKIVATVGPSSDSEETLRALALAGVNVFRLNFSHGTHQSHRNAIQRIKKVRQETGLPLAIMLDTKGPEIRTGDFKQHMGLTVQKGQTFFFYLDGRLGDAQGVSVTYQDLGKDISPGMTLLVDDGLVAFTVQNIEEDKITTVVQNEGMVGPHKSMNIPGASIRLPALTDKDVADIRFGISQDVDFIAASFIRRSEDVFEIRKILEEGQGGNIKIIAKIENEEGVRNQDEIIDIADGVMVARGDLGVEIETEQVPVVQKELIENCVKEGIYVITATQMLDSMIRNPRPTRAEVNDVANAILDGTSAVMLSGETAGGKYPLEAVRTMVRVCEITEEHLGEKEQYKWREISDPSITHTIAEGAVDIAEKLGAEAILVATATGFSARAIAKFRPRIRIIGVTPSIHALREMSLYWNVEGVLSSKEGENFIEDALEAALEAGKIKKGDLLVLVAGIPKGLTGSTNLIKVHQVVDIALKGIPMGGGIVEGKVRIADDRGNFSRDFHNGDILVAYSYVSELLPYVKRAGALIFEEGGLTSEGAVLGRELGKTTIVGARGALDFEHGRVMTVNGKTGEILRGSLFKEK